MLLDKDQFDDSSYSPTRKTEAFIISEAEDDSFRTGELHFYQKFLFATSVNQKNKVKIFFLFGTKY